MKKHGGNDSGFTLIELMIVVCVLGLLAAFAIGHLLRARLAADEASAIGTIRAVNNGQQVFRSTCGRGFFSGSLPTLSDGGYISPDASLSPKSGFSFALTAGAGAPGDPDCDGTPTGTQYYLAATPLSSGRRAFSTDEDGAIWQDSASVAPVEPFTSSATTTPLK